MTFEGQLYDRVYFEGLHKSHWFTNPPRRCVEAAFAPLPLIGPTFRYRILLSAVRP